MKEEAEAADAKAGKEKKLKEEEEAKQEARENAGLELAQIQNDKPIGKRTFKSNVFDDHVPSDQTDLEIMQINEQKLPWKANTCMLSKSHPARDSKKCDQDL